MHTCMCVPSLLQLSQVLISVPARTDNMYLLNKSLSTFLLSKKVSHPLVSLKVLPG